MNRMQIFPQAAGGSGGGSSWSWLTGSGVPSSGLGANGDYYLNTANGDLYTRASGTWSTVVNLMTIPAGSDKQIQFNDGGSVLGGSALLTFDKATGKVLLTGPDDGNPALQIGATYPLYFASNYPGWGFNSYFDASGGVNKYGSTGFAGDFYFDPTTGDFVIDQYPSGTAGATVSGGGEAFRLTTGGNLWLNGVPLGSIIAPRSDIVITTGTLANAASVSSYAASFAKSFAIVKLTVSATCRLRLYATATARDNDLTRTPGTPPTPGTSHGVIGDWILDGTPAAPLTNFICSPEVYGANADTPVSSNLYYTVTNLSGSSAAITVTLTTKIEES